ncbi:hypothetical protein [Actinomadura sp. 3N407]|uniref:hypothetical protein n=1 Tax=Actinomadura sp. 3N407 TaxID=3457423 RepID=UPI003FCE5CB4
MAETFTNRYVRRIWVDAGKITEEFLQPLEETWLTDTETGNVTGQGTDLPQTIDGVIERRPDGSEVLATIDGLRLELDGRGNILVNGSPHYSGVFMVVQSVHQMPRPD